MVEDLIRRAVSGEVAAQSQLFSLFGAEQSVRTEVLNRVAERASAGDGQSLDLLLGLIDQWRLDRPPIRRIVVNDADVEDIHQDVLILVAKKISLFRSESAFNTWLYTVSRNAAVDHVRRMKDTDRLNSDFEPMTYAQRLSSLVSGRTDLGDAVDELPEHYRAVIVLRDIEQKTYQQIADLLDIEMNTVKSRISRGRALLAQLVDLGDGWDNVDSGQDDRDG